jgi:hypothetical protein
MKRFFGVLMLLGGVGLASSVVHGLLSGRPVSAGSLGPLGFCLGLFVVGARWARGEAAPSDSEADEKPLPGRPPVQSPPARRPSPAARGLDDLSTLTLSGWCLLLATFALVVGEALCFVLLVPEAVALMNDRLWAAVIACAGLGVAAGFYLLGKVVFTRLGFPTFRDD